MNAGTLAGNGGARPTIFDAWETLFSDFQPSVQRRASSRGRFAIDVMEREDAYVVIADLAGASRDNIELVLDGEVLSIKVRWPEEALPTGSRYLHRERDTSELRRLVQLPKVSAQAVDAEFRDGLLRVTVRKAEEARVRRIEIK